MTREGLIEYLIKNETLKTPRIIEAFKNIDRADFVLKEYQNQAYEDYPLLIGYGATISQPTTVAIMLENLNPETGDRVLEIGTGSGYLTALLAEIAKNGIIFSIEYVPELKKFAQENLKKYNFKNIKLFVGNGKMGLVNYAPFDKIISSASGDQIPGEWKNQLKIGGKIVAPVKDNLIVLNKLSEKEFREIKYPGFLFVKLK